MLQPNGAVSQYGHWFPLSLEVTMRHGHRRLFMTIRNELGIPIATVIDDRFVHAAETRPGVGADVFEAQRLDDVDHVVGAATVRGENFNLAGKRSLLRRRSLATGHSGRRNGRSRAHQHSTLEKLPPLYGSSCHVVSLRGDDIEMLGVSLQEKYCRRGL